MTEQTDSLLEKARYVFQLEGEALLHLADQIDERFLEAVDLILQRPGRVIVTGIGKSGLVGRKISATLASTGTPSYFLHPAEALHGDLGMVAEGDVILMISYSGETNELLQLMPFFEENDNPVIAITGHAAATISQHASILLEARVAQEACPNDLAPTTSATAALVMGDALAVTLMHARHFQAEQFARFHPGGSLGRRLVTPVSAIMRGDDLPIVQPDSPLAEVVHAVSLGRLGLVVVVSGERQINGIITDGDIRRAMETHQAAFFDLEAQDIMTPQPQAIPPSTKLFEAEQLMLQQKINSLLVVEEHKLLGIIQIYHIPS